MISAAARLPAASGTLANRLNGTAGNVDGYLDHVRELRVAMKSGELRVVKEITDDGATPQQVAGRYITRLQMHEGAVVRAECTSSACSTATTEKPSLYDVAQVIGDEGDALMAG